MKIKYLLPFFNDKEGYYRSLNNEHIFYVYSDYSHCFDTEPFKSLNDAKKDLERCLLQQGFILIPEKEIDRYKQLLSLL